jgi:hypothetical protein
MTAVHIKNTRVFNNGIQIQRGCGIKISPGNPYHHSFLDLLSHRLTVTKQPFPSTVTLSYNSPVHSVTRRRTVVEEGRKAELNVICVSLLIFSIRIIIEDR